VDGVDYVSLAASTTLYELESEQMTLLKNQRSAWLCDSDKCA